MDDTRPRAFLFRALSLVLVLTYSASLGAQSSELSTADRLRMLYATQLTFTAEGDPVIRLGLLEGEERVEFTPNRTVRVLPSGESGPVVELPGGKTYTVTVSEQSAGRYKHWVIVDRLPVAQRGRAEEIQKSWTARGYLVEPFEVGGLFAVRGKVFDSRVILFAVGGDEKISKARKIQRKLQDKYGIEGGLHSDLVAYPSAMISLKGEGVDVKVSHRDILQISALPGEDEDIRYKIPGIKKSYSKGTETRTYSSTLIFAPDRDGKLVLINSLGAERALRGVVPSEIYASAPQPALQAQAIAARNEIFSAIGVRNLADPYMLRSDVYDQVYKGVGAEDKRTTKAVEATRGKVMFYGDQIVEAFYSSNAGGFTENNENVWDMEARPYLRGRADAPAKKVPRAWRDGIDESELEEFLAKGFEAYSKIASVSSAKLFRWEKTVKVSEPRKWLKEAGHKVGTIKNFKVLSRGKSGRIMRLEVEGTRGKAVIARELNVRRLFGGLRSGLFIMTQQKNKKGHVTSMSFKGAGFGHGVGMCQTGAIGMADNGFEAEEILKHYYSGIEIKSLY